MILLDKLILLIGCSLFFISGTVDIFTIIICLSVLIFVCANLYFDNPYLRSISISVYLGLCLPFPSLLSFLPLMVYDIALYRIKPLYLCAVLLCLYMISIPYPQVYPILVITVFTCILAYRTANYQLLQDQYKKQRDSSRELNLLLKNKNADLVARQYSEIHIATLKERNRIAREIHDNVGHMLSRSILQVGALTALNQNEMLGSHLEDLKNSLDTAMESIRQSVHDLHDQSIDLKSSVNSIIQALPALDILFDYDMGSSVPKELKYCFVAIIKEALTNVQKHSNATKTSITLREHPAFYQLLIEDNGTVEPDFATNGIGLENMKERVEALNGTLRITACPGVRIFISIPKGSLNKEENKVESRYNR